MAPLPHYPSRASALPKSGRPELGRRVVRRSCLRPEACAGHRDGQRRFRRRSATQRACALATSQSSRSDDVPAVAGDRFSRERSSGLLARHDRFRRRALVRLDHLADPSATRAIVPGVVNRTIGMGGNGAARRRRPGAGLAGSRPGLGTGRRRDWCRERSSPAITESRVRADGPGQQERRARLAAGLPLCPCMLSPTLRRRFGSPISRFCERWSQPAGPPLAFIALVLRDGATGDRLGGKRESLPPDPASRPVENCRP